MPLILKKTFLFHYDPTINSDKVFNLFVIDNEDGTFSTLQEYGRSGTKLNIKPVIENCSRAAAESRFSAKLNEKVYHRRTPYTHTLNPSTSPTYKKFAGALKVTAGNPGKTQPAAKVLNFKSAETLTEEENSSGQQSTNEGGEKSAKKIGVLNLNQLDALEI